MTVSLEEAVKGAEKRVRLPAGKELNVKFRPASWRVSRFG